MIVSELFENVLLERRPDVVSELRKYASDPNVYITFVDIPKVGLNPKTTYNTPLGIYAYPVQAYWHQIEHGSVPFAADRPFVYVLEALGKILDLAHYSAGEFEADKEMLHGLYGSIILPKFSRAYDEDRDDEFWDAFIEKSISTARTLDTITNPYAFAIWHVTMVVAGQLGGSLPAAWNKVFRALGYSGVADKTGQGIIHPNEPTQAVFFSKQSVRVAEMLHNVRRQSAETFGDYPVMVDSVEDLSRILFYGDDEGGDNEQGKFLMKEWPELLKTGKSAHFAAKNTHDFFESFYSSDELYGGVRDGLSGFFTHIRLSVGAVTHLFEIAKIHEEAWSVIAEHLPEFIKEAYLTRADIALLTEPTTLKALAELGVTDIGESIVKWALRPVRQNGQTRRERKAQLSWKKARPMTVHDVLSKIGPNAKNVLKLVSPDQIQTMIDTAYHDNIPF
jgi:hypothetical protein